eukprot:UN09146
MAICSTRNKINRQYPWGNKWDSSKVPPFQYGRTFEHDIPINQYPQGESPFGVGEMFRP